MEGLYCKYEGNHGFCNTYGVDVLSTYAVTRVNEDYGVMVSLLTSVTRNL